MDWGSLKNWGVKKEGKGYWGFSKTKRALVIGDPKGQGWEIWLTLRNFWGYIRGKIGVNLEGQIFFTGFFWEKFPKWGIPWVLRVKNLGFIWVRPRFFKGGLLGFLENLVF